jgi:hypothetical protein
MLSIIARAARALGLGTAAPPSPAAPVDTKNLVVRYDLIVTFLGDFVSDHTRSFATAAARQEAVDEILAAGGLVPCPEDDIFVSDDDPGIEVAELVFEDCVPFWRKSLTSSTLPDEAPALFTDVPYDQRFLRLSCPGQNSYTYETSGFSLRQTKAMWSKKKDYPKSPTEAEIVWRRTAYELRGATLMPVD